MHTRRHQTTSTNTPTNAPGSCRSDTQAHANEHALPDDWWTAGGYDTADGRIEYDWNQRYWRAVLPDSFSVVFPTEAQAVDYLKECDPIVVRNFLHHRYRS